MRQRHVQIEPKTFSWRTLVTFNSCCFVVCKVVSLRCRMDTCCLSFKGKNLHSINNRIVPRSQYSTECTTTLTISHTLPLSISLSWHRLWKVDIYVNWYKLKNNWFNSNKSSLHLLTNKLVFRIFFIYAIHSVEFQQQ